MNQTERCDISDLFTDQCHHCTAGYPTLGPIDGGLYLDEDEEEL